MTALSESDVESHAIELLKKQGHEYLSPSPRHSRACSGIQRNKGNHLDIPATRQRGSGGVGAQLTPTVNLLYFPHQFTNYCDFSVNLIYSPHGNSATHS